MMRGPIVGALILAVSGPGTGLAQSTLPDTIARCGGVNAAIPDDWSEVTFDGVALRVPRGFKASGRIVGVDHGGQEWVRGRAAVDAIRGFYYLGSFASGGGTRCVAEVRGHQVLLIEQVSAGKVSLLAWYPSFGPVFHASSDRAKDLQMLRKVLLSASAR